MAVKVERMWVIAPEHERPLELVMVNGVVIRSDFVSTPFRGEHPDRIRCFDEFGEPILPSFEDEDGG